MINRKLYGSLPWVIQKLDFSRIFQNLFTFVRPQHYHDIAYATEWLINNMLALM